MSSALTPQTRRIRCLRLVAVQTLGYGVLRLLSFAWRRSTRRSLLLEVRLGFLEPV